LTQKNILIAGSSGFASECYGILLDNMTRDKTLHFGGFLAPDNQLQRYGLEKHYLGHEKDYRFKSEDKIIIGVGQPALRKKIFDYLKDKRANICNLVSFYSLIAPGLTIGEGNIIAPYCTLPASVKIGDGNLINSYSSLGHDVQVGNFNVISSYCNLTGFSSIGSQNQLGISTIMLPNSCLGNDCKVAPGSVIYKGFKNNVMIAGNPAHKIGKIER